MMSDLMLCIGSSLRVTPACDIPVATKMAGKRLVIVNLQKTPLDSMADLVIHGLADKVISLLMQKLDLDTPTFKLDRWMKVSIAQNKTDISKETVTVRGIDKSGGYFELFKKI